MAATDGRAQAEGNLTRTVLKALDVLDCLAVATEPLTAQAVAQRCGLSRATAHRLLTTLERRGYARGAGSGRYQLGQRLLHLSSLLLRQLDLPLVARPELREVSHRVDETAYLAVLDGIEVLYIDKVESSQSVRLYSGVGTRNPLHCTSLGKAILAFLPDEERATLLGRLTLTRRTPNTISDRGVLEAHLNLVRAQGYAVDNIENEDHIRCVSAPIFDHDGRVTAAISVSGPAFRVSVERVPEVAAVVMEGAGAISRKLGYLPPAADGVVPVAAGE